MKYFLYSTVCLFLLCLLSSSLLSQSFTKENPNDPIYIIKTSHGDIYLELFIEEAPQTVNNFTSLANGQLELKGPNGKVIRINHNFYDNLIFHRVIKDFMIQGGCPKGNGTGDPGYKFEDEINAEALKLHTVKAFNPENGQPHPFIAGMQWQPFIIGTLCQKLGIKSQEELDKRIPELIQELGKLNLKDCYEMMGYKYDSKLKSHHPLRGVLAMANSGPNTNGSQFFINLVDTPWLAGKHTVFGKVVGGMDVVDKIATEEVGKNAKPKKDIKIISVRPYEEKKINIDEPEKKS